MKKHSIIHTLAACAALLATAACTSELEYVEGEPDDANCAGVYFLSSEQELEFEPGTQDTLHVTLCRSNTQGAINVPLVVTTNEDDTYVVPEQVAFADGESTATVVVSFSRMEAGATKKLALTVGQEYILKYGNVGTHYDYSVSVSLIQWQTLGEDEEGETIPGFWLDGLFCSVFTTMPQLPLAVDLEQAKLPSGEIRFRFTSPYSELCEYVYPLDGTTKNVAFIGFPYNSEDDLNGRATKAVISVKDGKASVKPFILGNDWGYGAFNAGSVIGNITTSTGVITDESAYPLGKLDTLSVEVNKETGDTLDVKFLITFPENSLYIGLPTLGILPCSQVSYLTNDPQFVLDTFYTGEKPEPEPYEPTWTKQYTGTYIHAAHVLNTKGKYDPAGKPLWTYVPNFVLSKEWSVYVQDPIPGQEDTEEQYFRIQPWITDDGVLEFTWNADNTLTVNDAYTGVATDVNDSIKAQDMVTASKQKKDEYVSYYDYKTQTFVFKFAWHDAHRRLGYTEDLFVLDLSRSVKRKAHREPIPYTPVPMSRDLRTDLPETTFRLLHPFDF